MKIHSLERRQRIDRPIGEVFSFFFSDPANLDRLTPPWLHFRMLTPTPIEMRVGLNIEYLIRWRGLPVRWLTEIEEVSPGRRFVDRQIRGPYRLWHHTHSFDYDDGKTVMTDEVRYALPAGLLGTAIHHLIVRRDIARIFDFRAKRVCELMELSATSPALRLDSVRRG